MTIQQQNNSALVVTVTPPVAANKIMLVGDIATLAQCSVSWVKIVTGEMRIETMRLSNNARVFTEAQANAIIGEIERRRMESMR